MKPASIPNLILLKEDL